MRRPLRFRRRAGSRCRLEFVPGLSSPTGQSARPGGASLRRVSALLVCRLTGLGAENIAEGRTWVVMGDPSGLHGISKGPPTRLSRSSTTRDLGRTRPVTNVDRAECRNHCDGENGGPRLHRLRQRSRQSLHYPCLAMGVLSSARSGKRCRRRRLVGTHPVGAGGSAWRLVRPAGRGAGPGRRRRSRCPRRCRWEPGTSRARRSPRDLGWRRSPSSRQRRSPTLLRGRPRTR